MGFSGEKSAPFPTPPAINTILPRQSLLNPSIAAIVAPTFVPLESSKNSILYEQVLYDIYDKKFEKIEELKDRLKELVDNIKEEKDEQLM
jgi:hypothetical protein